MSRQVAELLREHNVDEAVIDLVTEILLAEAVHRMECKVDQIMALTDQLASNYSVPAGGGPWPIVPEFPPREPTP